MIHLLSASGSPFAYKYQYHHFGPYSAELQAEVDEMVERGYLEEIHEDNAYVYALTGKGRKMLERLEQEEGYRCDLDVEKARKLTEENSQFLEMVSTYAFLVQSGDEPEEAARKAVELKNHLADLMDQAVKYYRENLEPNGGGANALRS